MMAFEVFKPSGPYEQLAPGTCSLSARGMACLHPADLDVVGISTHAVILIDRPTGRVGLRAPNGMPGVTVSNLSGSVCRTVWIGGALRAIGRNPADLHGRHACAIVDDRIELCLPPPADPSGDGAERPSAEC